MMFTGIVTHLGELRAARPRRGVLELEIEAPGIARELEKGDSIAVNGVCLTATDVRRRRFFAQAMGETLARSTLGELERSEPVNLELSARLSDRMGGHLVQGHVDGIAEALRVDDEDGARRIWWRAGQEVLRYLVPRGSIALDGVALTLVEVGRTSFQVAVIPHTLSATTLGRVETGSRTNVEVDLIAKYVERLTTGPSGHVA
jgi:riboflavin synthase